MGVDRAALYRDPDAELPRRRRPAVPSHGPCAGASASRSPTSSGSKGFRRLDLAVDARVLVPRPETELLVEVALGLPQGARVLDLGHRQRRRRAGAEARAPRPRRHRQRRVSAARSRSRGPTRSAWAWTSPSPQSHLLDGVSGAFDAIVSNPPYVADAERALLAPEITRHEPALARCSPGPTGSSSSATSSPPRPRARRGWRSSSAPGQADAVEALMRDAGYEHIERHRDLAGIERVLVATR